MTEDWDIDSHRYKYESDTQWELRKNFMLTHKDKFPKYELLCLAQTFVNVEILGCRYPEETMARIAELAKGVVESYQEKTKNMLKRTFVAASDAASARAKGTVAEKQLEGPLTKKTKTDCESTQQSSTCSTQFRTVENKNSTKVPKYGGVKTFDIKSKEQVNSPSTSDKPLGNFVIFLSNGDKTASDDIHRSAAVNRVTIRWDFEEGVGHLKVCKLYLNNKFIATGVGENKKQSKENTAINAVAKLRESYYAIMIKVKFFSVTIVDSKDLGDSSNPKNFEPLGKDNIGQKLMKLMGWKGGGLGSKEQGIEEPITPTLQVQRQGLGAGKHDSDFKTFRKKVADYVKNWINSDSDQDLVFSSEFSIEERKLIHEVARRFSLKSKSYGKNNDRQLVISRKLDPWDIVLELEKAGGSSDKYELLRPIKV